MTGGVPSADALEAWLGELGLGPAERRERDGIAAWDLRLDGRRRFDVPLTVILDPATGAIAWLHLAPPIADSFRASYRKLLRWNDEIPFVKFALAADGRPVAAVEIPAQRLDADELGLAVARLLATADLLLEDVAGWIWIGGRLPDWQGRVSRQEGLLDRYAARLGELAGPR